MVDAGVRLVTPNGNTGEFYALTARGGAARDRVRRARPTAAPARRRRPADVLAGVGHDLPSAIEAGRHARDNGVRMIMVHQPVGPYMSAAGWLEYHRAIAGALPDLGVVLYIRDPRIGARHIRLLGDLCPNVIAVKYGIRDPVLFAAVARDAGLDRFTWLAGLAELTAPACWTAGARGFTSGLVNVAPGLALSMLESLRGGDTAGAMKAWEALPPLRGTARRRLLRGQRERGQGGPRPARAVPAGRAPAQSPGLRRRAGPDHRDPRRWGLSPGEENR